MTFINLISLSSLNFGIVVMLGFNCQELSAAELLVRFYEIADRSGLIVKIVNVENECA